MMNSIFQSKGEKIHSRTITISTYDCDEQRMIVEGILKDDRFQDSYILTGEKFPSGVVHHMAVRLLINCSNLLIEEIELDLIHIPRDVCQETMACLAPIKGLHVRKGFTAKVKSLAGGEKGCTHVVELLLAMAPAVIQGYAAHQWKKPGAIDPERVRMNLRMLVNTCRIWREDGPMVERLRTLFNLK